MFEGKKLFNEKIYLYMWNVENTTLLKNHLETRYEEHTQTGRRQEEDIEVKDIFPEGSPASMMPTVQIP